MSSLIQQILICLIAAVLLGFILGWLFKRIFGSERNRVEDLEAQLEAAENAQKQTQVQLGEVQGELAVSTQRLDQQAKEIGDAAATAERLGARVEELEPLDAELARTRAVLVKANDGLNRYKNALEMEIAKRQRYQAEAKVLRQRVDKLMPLRSQFADLSDSHHAQADELVAMREQISLLSPLESQVESTKSTLNALESDNAELRAKVATLEHYQARASTAEAAVSKAQAEVSLLKARIDTLEPLSTQAQQLQQTLQETERRHQQFVEQRDAESQRQLEQVRADAERQIGELKQTHQQSLERQQAELATNDELNALQASYGSLEAQFAQSQQAVEAARQHATEVQSELGNTIAKQRKSLESQAATLENLRAEKTELSETLNRIQTEYDAVAADFERIKATNEHRSEHDEAQTQRLQETLSGQQTQLAALTTENANLRSQSEAVAAELARANAELGQIKNKADAYPPLQARFTDLQASFADLQQSHSSIKHEIGRIAALRGEIAERDATVQRLEAQIRAQGLRKDDEIRQLSEQLREIEGVRLEFQQARREQSDLQRLLDESKARHAQELEASRQQLKSVETELSQATEQAAVARDETARAAVDEEQQQRLDALTAEIESLRREREHQRKELQTIRQAPGAATQDRRDREHEQARPRRLGIQSLRRSIPTLRSTRGEGRVNRPSFAAHMPNTEHALTGRRRARQAQTPKRDRSREEVGRLKALLKQAQSSRQRAQTTQTRLARLKVRLDLGAHHERSTSYTAQTPSVEPVSAIEPVTAAPTDAVPAGSSTGDVGTVAKRNIRSALSTALSSASDLTEPTPTGSSIDVEQDIKQSRQLFTPPKEKDDLKKIYGIGPVLEKTLNGLGITTYKQIAEFSREDIERVAEAIETFPDRIERDKWVEGAREEYVKKYGNDQGKSTE